MARMPWEIDRTSGTSYTSSPKPAAKKPAEKKPAEKKPAEKKAAPKPAAKTEHLPAAKKTKKAPAKKEAAAEKPKPKKTVRQYLEDLFPSYVWAVDDPELGPVLKQAAEEEWDTTRIQGALQGTEWWKTTSITARRAKITQEQDPAEWGRQMQAAKEIVRQKALDIGLPLSDTWITSLATDSLTLGYNEAQMEQAVLSSGALAKISADRVASGDVGGKVSDFNLQVDQIADEWMLGLSANDKLGWAKKMVRGEKNISSFTSYAQMMARKNLPFIADLIDQGMTPGEALSPYRNSIAEQLELAPSAVDFMDGRFQRVLQSKEDKNRLATTSELKSNVRQEFAAEWDVTQNAQRSAHQVVAQMATAFGRRA